MTCRAGLEKFGPPARDGPVSARLPARWAVPARPRAKSDRDYSGSLVQRRRAADVSLPLPLWNLLLSAFLLASPSPSNPLIASIKSEESVFLLPLLDRDRDSREREREREMSRVADSVLFDAANQLFHLSEMIEKLVFPAAQPYDGAHGSEERGFVGVPVDILETPKGYTFLDVPGLSKADIQVTLEDEKMLVIKSSGKRKREEGEEGCRYLLLERWGSPKFLRRFQLPGDSKSPTPLPSLPGVRMECSPSSWRSFLRRPSPRPRP